MTYSPGDVVGGITLLHRLPYDRVKGVSRWMCRCHCGREWAVRSRGMGAMRSCGCMKRQLLREAGTKHGGSRTAEYAIWANILYRCSSRRAANYHLYGGRGITVCEHWRLSFAAFLSDVGPRPSPGHSIDRIDYNGNYEPGNVRWATSTEQNNNKRNTTMLSHDGVTLPLQAWALRAGLPAHTIYARLRHGWTVADTLTRPIDQSKVHYRGMP